MKERDFINKLKDLNLGIITISDASKIINKNMEYTALYMKRLEDRNVIVRVEKGKYALTDTDISVIASNLIYPSYVSFLSGLSFLHETTQIPIITQTVTTVSKKNIEFQKQKIEFIKFNKKRMFGYKKEKMKNGYIFIGEIEKIIIDSLFMPKYCPLSEIKNPIDNADLDKMLSYALKMNSIVTLKRLGYLLDLEGIDVYNKLKPHLNKRYDPLNPLLDSKGEKNKKWMLKINEVL